VPLSEAIRDRDEGARPPGLNPVASSPESVKSPFTVMGDAQMAVRRPGGGVRQPLPSAAQVLDRVLDGRPLLALLRNLPIDRTVALAEAVWDTGLGTVAVPLHSPASRDALAAVARLAAERGEVPAAAGVLTPELVPIAKKAGAAITLAPGFDPDVLRVSLAAGLPHIPGAVTATEVQRAYRAGCRWLTVFPAAPLGPDWIRDLHQSFPDISLIATGGVTPADAADFRLAGARCVGVDNALTAPGGLSALVAALS
jgi:2-dehydro-3-deoxyphosphogluconate aldolase / (4S)-4-hydroxy-2-oxoglutarate aldolase